MTIDSIKIGDVFVMRNGDVYEIVDIIDTKLFIKVNDSDARIVCPIGWLSPSKIAYRATLAQYPAESLLDYVTR